MEEVLERLTDQEKDIAFVGTTVVQTEQLLRDLETLDTCAQVTVPHNKSHNTLHNYSWRCGSKEVAEQNKMH